MFTQGHYKVVAFVVQSCKNPTSKDDLVNHLVLAFRMDNPRFDEAKFRQLCGLDANTPAAKAEPTGASTTPTVPVPEAATKE